MNTFEDDLYRGKKIEHMVCDFVKSKYPLTYVIDGKHSEFDIWIPEIKRSIEVKYDFKSLETGNYVIEVEMFGKDSGLFVTKADHWVLFDSQLFVWTTPQDIMKLIIKKKLSSKVFTSKGDVRSKEAYLIPVKYIKEIANLQHTKI